MPSPDDDRPGPSILIIALGILTLVFIASAAFGSMASQALPLDDFLEHIERNEVAEVVFRDAGAELLLRPGDLKDGTNRRRRVNFINTDNASEYEALIRERKRANPAITTQIKVLPPSGDGRLLFYLLTTGLFLGAFYLFFLRPLRAGAGGGILNFGKSRHRDVGKRTGVRLEDVAGIAEAKAEVTEVIEYLKNPEKFRRIGARIPKGVLLIGAPGTGKTLLAKAVAGEAGVKFFAASGSDFVEMFAGVGASRARDLFKTARENSPCILFLDEIDAVGRQRNASVGSHDERDQTLNQILVEMDGFGTETTVIVIAATNRPDILDNALLRPGRFDRKISLDLPDIKGRKAILEVHAAKVRTDASVDLEVAARATPGFSGAELEALINEAALAAALDDREVISQHDLEEARDKVRWGRQKQSRAMSDDELKATAWHEAGHTLLALRIPECDPVHKVTIIPRGMALGATMSLPEKDVVGYRRRQVLAKICMCYGGRVAEARVTDDLSTGAANDLEQATGLARRMVCEWGMGEELNTVSFTDRRDGPQIDRLHSERTAEQIDAQVRAILDGEYERARTIIDEQGEALERIAEGLLRYETITGEEALALADGTAPEALRPSPLSEPELDAPAGLDQPPEA